MKKAFLILGAVAVSAAAGGLTAWAVAGGREGSVQYIEVERTPALGTQFTSYQAEQYPDLTYAAENAVKAVVNIEAVQQVEMPRRRGYDPFLEFFGIPQGYDEGPQFREQRAGGSGVIISADGYVAEDRGFGPADAGFRIVRCAASGRVGAGDRFAVRPAIDHYGGYRERQGA